MKKTNFYFLILIAFIILIVSCNKQPIQKTEKIVSEELTPIIEEEEVFNIDNLYKTWELIKEDLDPNFANFVGDKVAYVYFEVGSNEVINMLCDTISGDTTIIKHGYTLKEERFMTVYELESQQLVTKNYIDKLTDSLLTTKVNYGSVGREFELNYKKAEQPNK